MITRIAAKGGRWFPVTVIEATPKQMRAGQAQYTAYSATEFQPEGLVLGTGDTIEEAVDSCR